ncbi:MAG TPA: hypothetical protein P5305_01355 [Rubrivivax sp.]|nr:hypothetical protein [Rubrivivax sp.]HRY86499.1 hypothetical protein [Rubrivivax sp.]
MIATDRIVDSPAFALDAHYIHRPDGTTVALLTTHKGAQRTGAVRSFSVTLSPVELRALRDSLHEALLRTTKIDTKGNE